MPTTKSLDLEAQSLVIAIVLPTPPSPNFLLNPPFLIIEKEGGGGIILRCFYWLLNVKLWFQGLLFSQSKINFFGL